MTFSDEIESLKIMEKCPKFQRCSAPVCPLDLLQDERDSLKDEPKCTLAKSICHRIGKGTTLKRQGYTKGEWAAKKRWEKVPEDEKRRRTAHLRVGS